MADHKNNHFVPVFYLKLWSHNEKQVNSYLISKQKSVIATINDEVSKDYLYGKDGQVENLFADLEGEIEKIIKKIIISKVVDISSLSEAECINLKAFMTIGEYRTQWYKKHLNSIVDSIGKTLINNALLQSDSTELPIGWEDKVTINASFPQMMKEMLPHLFLCSKDLSLILFTADKETTEFITSDNPVVILNPLAEQLEFSGTGLSSAGIIMFMPICPQFALFAYDSNAYEIRPEFVSCDDLNKIMACNAVNNIYYKNLHISTVEDYLESRVSIDNSPKLVKLEGKPYLKVGKGSIPCQLSEHAIKLKLDMDYSKYFRQEVAPNKFVIIRRESERWAKTFEAYKEFLHETKKQCEQNSIDIKTIDTSIEAFLKTYEQN